MYIKLKNIEEMKQFALIISEYLIDNPRTIYLDGELGAGKTTFTQFIAHGLAIDDYVVSPTFNIMKRYEGKNVFLNHFDLYRIKNEVYELGFEEYWYSNDINIIEWAQYLDDEFADLNPIKINIEVDADATRVINIEDDELIKWLKEHANEIIC